MLLIITEVDFFKEKATLYVYTSKCFAHVHEEANSRVRSILRINIGHRDYPRTLAEWRIENRARSKAAALGRCTATVLTSLRGREIPRGGVKFQMTYDRLVF